MVFKKTKLKYRILATVFFAIVTMAAESQEWESLIRSDLSNWEHIGGEASYVVKNGVITGKASKLNVPNAFLVTKKKYSDFILEFEFMHPRGFNSGVQFRSNTDPKFRDGALHGYQMEIDGSDRAWTGGIFDEQRRKWIYPVTINPKGRDAFKFEQWNTARIEAVGNSIRTWINGQMVANLVDNLDSKGVFGLQVHGIQNNHKLLGAEVKWKNMRILTKNIEDHRRPADVNVPERSYLVNELTDWEKRNGYRLLWDGKTNDGWRGAKLQGFPKKGWQFQDGVLTVLATDGGESTGPGDIITKENFSDFELELEFNLTEGANSGIKYFVDPELNRGAGSAIGLEYQILDNKNHPDAKKGVKGNRTLGSLYDLITMEDLSNENSRKGRIFKGVGTWNKARIVVRDGHVQHWLNDIKIVEFDRFSQIFRALVAYSKYKDWPNFGEFPEGPILLQDHGDTVHYRSIKVRELN